MVTVEEARVAYVAARLQHDVASAAAKQAKRAQLQAEDDLVEALLDTEMTQIKMESGLTLFLRKVFKVSISQENQGITRQWLLDTTGDDQPFVTEQVDKKAVEEHCKTLDKDEVPGFLHLHTRPAIGVRNWGAAKEDHE